MRGVSPSRSPAEGSSIEGSPALQPFLEAGCGWTCQRPVDFFDAAAQGSDVVRSGGLGPQGGDGGEAGTGAKRPLATAC